MIKNMNGTLLFSEKPKIISSAAIAGKMESEGPLKDDFDKIIYDSYAGQETFEKAESELVKETVQTALEKAGLKARAIDLALSGDLLNQCVASSFALRGFSIPYFGIYGACSTMALGLINAAVAVESGAATSALCTASSHFCTAERQYRFPLEYGTQRTTTAQWTVTAAGCAVVAKEDFASPAARKNERREKNSHSSLESGADSSKNKQFQTIDENISKKNSSDKTEMFPYINAATLGIITDLAVTDQNNMGAAMAPAAVKIGT